MPSSARTARSSSPRSRPSTTRQRSGPSGSSTTRCARAGPPTRSALKRPLAHREHDLRPLRPPVAEHPVQLGRDRAAGAQSSGVRGSASSAATARSNASASRACAGARVGEHGRTGALGTLNDEPGNEPRHRAIVADEHAIAATVQREPEPPPEAPTLLVHHRLRPRHPIEAAFGSTVVVPVGEERSPAGKIGRRRPQPPCGSRRLRHLGIRLVVHGVGDTDRRSTGSPSAPPDAGSCG